MFLILGNFYLKLDVQIFDILRNILYMYVLDCTITINIVW